MKLLSFAWFLPILLVSTVTVTLADESSKTDTASGNGNTGDVPIVTLSQGKLQGFTQVSRNGNKYFSFLGVPYAKSKIRFGAPQPPDSWNGTKLATKLAPHCFQFCLVEQRHVGKENCLTLNIYTPTLSEDANLPVLVLLHGGGFQFGSGSFSDGRYIVDENALVVTVQYRLGALGFLNVGDGDETVVSNAGLRDQNAALKWVQQNINKFGGDTSKVTIFGYSAGGASVHYHMLSPMSSGLFARAISQSGTALNPWAFQQKPKDLAKRLAENVECTTENPKEMVECLRSKTPAQIVNGQLKFSKFPHEFDLISMLFCPSAEEGNVEPKFLPDTPYNLMISDRTASRVPYIVGVTADEGALYTALILENEKSLEKINSDWYKMAPNILYYESTANPAMYSSISRKVWDFYLHDKKIGKETYLEFGQVLGDRFFVTGVRRAILEHAKKPEFPVYPYIFNYTGTHSITQGMLFTKEAYGVSHGEDLKYLFDKTFGAPTYEKGDEAEFSKKLIQLFVSFARDGKPTTFGTAGTWKPYINKGPEENDTPIPWYVIDEDTKILNEDPFKERTDFWESLPISELQNEGMTFTPEKEEL